MVWASANTRDRLGARQGEMSRVRGEGEDSYMPALNNTNHHVVKEATRGNYPYVLM